MALEDYLQTLRGGEFSDPGEFTMAADRARELLQTRVLTDQWSAWICLAQGFVALGARSLEVTISRQAVAMAAELPHPTPLVDLIRQDRFLLGWLNLGFFGSPHWSAAEGVLMVEWRGNAWARYRSAASMEGLLERDLAYAPIPVTVGGKALARRALPARQRLTLYPLPDDLPGGLRFEDSSGGQLGPFERREFWLDGLGPRRPSAQPMRLAAFAGKTSVSWSQVNWVQHGAVISRERNTLERPGVEVVACVDSLGLETDLTGFSVVTNQAYLDFIKQLKTDVLWML